MPETVYGICGTNKCRKQIGKYQEVDVTSKFAELGTLEAGTYMVTFELSMSKNKGRDVVVNCYVHIKGTAFTDCYFLIPADSSQWKHEHTAIFNLENDTDDVYIDICQVSNSATASTDNLSFYTATARIVKLV